MGTEKAGSEWEILDSPHDSKKCWASIEKPGAQADSREFPIMLAEVDDGSRKT
jgi:hypothetical protein